MSGNPVGEDTPKKTPTPRKRKAKGEAAADGEGEVTPAKRGRKKNVSEDVVGDEEEEALPLSLSLRRRILRKTFEWTVG